MRYLGRIGLIMAVLLVGGVGYVAGTAHVLTPQRAVAADECQAFPETGKQVCGRFLEYWRDNGGLAQQGLPLTEAVDRINPTDGKTYKTQYFERARFEYHPENQPPYDVLLGLLGREQARARYPNGSPPSGVHGFRQTCFPETGFCVLPRFYEYWLANGGVAQQGYPISEYFYEQNPTNGKFYYTQYFERARFEAHAENAAPYDVLLGLLGSEQLLAQPPTGQPGSGAGPIFPPTATTTVVVSTPVPPVVSPPPPVATPPPPPPPPTPVIAPTSVPVPQPTAASAKPAGGGRAAPQGSDCPVDYPIKGNRSSMIYHVPGGAYYARTIPEDCFATGAAAEAAGYRQAQR